MDDVPVVLVHGFASSFERNWRETGWADLLRDEGRSVIGADLLGHGRAAKPHDPSAYAGLEQSITAAMPAAGRADAVGFSLGAQLLLRLAAASPGRFRRIVLGGIGDGVFARTDPEPVARAVETGQASPDAGPSAAALACRARLRRLSQAGFASVAFRRPKCLITRSATSAGVRNVLLIRR